MSGEREREGQRHFFKNQEILTFWGEKDLKKFNPRLDWSVMASLILST